MTEMMAPTGRSRTCLASSRNESALFSRLTLGSLARAGCGARVMASEGQAFDRRVSDVS